MDDALAEEIRKMMEEANPSKAPELQVESGESNPSPAPEFSPQGWSSLHPHLLSLTTSRCEWYLRIGVWECVGCHSVAGLGEESYHCDRCQKDVCKACFQRTLTQTLPGAMPVSSSPVKNQNKQTTSKPDVPSPSVPPPAAFPPPAPKAPPTARSRMGAGGTTYVPEQQQHGVMANPFRGLGTVPSARGKTNESISSQMDPSTMQSSKKEEELLKMEAAVRDALMQKQRAIQEEAQKLAVFQEKLKEIPNSKQTEIYNLRQRLEQTERSLVWLQSDCKKKKERYEAAQAKLEQKMKEKEKYQMDLTNLIMSVEKQKEQKLEEIIQQMNLVQQHQQQR